MNNPFESQAASTGLRSDYQIGLDEGKNELQTRITELEAQLAVVQKNAAWQPIETAPKDGKDLLLSDGVVRIAFWDTARGGLWSKWPGREECKYPNHWMPLPKPPIAGEAT